MNPQMAQQMAFMAALKRRQAPQAMPAKPAPNPQTSDYALAR